MLKKKSRGVMKVFLVLLLSVCLVISSIPTTFAAISITSDKAKVINLIADQDKSKRQQIVSEISSVSGSVYSLKEVAKR